MTELRALIARAALRLAYALAPATSDAAELLREPAQTLGSGGAGPWRPKQR
jgi:hypothetical protein